MKIRSQQIFKSQETPRIPGTRAGFSADTSALFFANYLNKKIKYDLFLIYD
jgi:hypothetical protein